MSSVPATPRPAGARPEARKLPWSRTLHRIVSIIAVLVMLWMSITGMSMQIIDLHAIWTHEPPTTPTTLSMEEGSYGPGDYAVIQASDFSAPALPPPFDIRQGVHMVLQAAHAQQSSGGAAAGGANGSALIGGSGDTGPAPHGHSPHDGGNPGSAHAGRPLGPHEPGGINIQTHTADGAPAPHHGPRKADANAPAGSAESNGGDGSNADGPHPHHALANGDAEGASRSDDATTTHHGPRRAEAGAQVGTQDVNGSQPYHGPPNADGGPGGGLHQHQLTDGTQPASGGDRQHATSADKPGGRSGQSVVSAGANAAGQQDGPQGGPGGRGRGGPGGGQPAPMAWVELRMINNAPAGQVMLGTKLVAFNALTGATVEPVQPVQIPQGGRLPPSLRQKLKTLHRFWNRHDTPGVYFEFIVGLVLLFLIISGLVIYFQMLGLRFRQRTWQPFWTAGGWWRSTHRIVSVFAAVFLLLLAFTGTWIGFESSAGPLRRTLMSSGSGPGGAPPAGRQAGSGPQAGPGQQTGGTGDPAGRGGRGRRRNPIDFIIPLRDGEVEEMTDTTLTAMNQLHPSTPIKALRLRIYGQMKQGVVIRGGDETDQYVFNADTGEPASLTEQGYPASFPFGTQVHENVKHFHSGAMFGVTGRVMNLLSGFSLAFLSISGLVMYFDMWLKRRRGGKGSFAWR